MRLKIPLDPYSTMFVSLCLYKVIPHQGRQFGRRLLVGLDPTEFRLDAAETTLKRSDGPKICPDNETSG